jgi:hypothetical protein
VPRHIARLVTRLVAPLVVDYSASRRLVVHNSVSRRLVVDYSASRRLVIDNSTSRRLVVDYFASVARPGTSAHARLVTRLVAQFIVDYFASAARLGASACRAARHTACRAACCRLLCVAQARRQQLRLAQARR